MIRVDTDGVMQYKLVEDTQVTRIETRTIAARLSQEDADQIAGLLNVANGKVEQAPTFICDGCQQPIICDGCQQPIPKNESYASIGGNWVPYIAPKAYHLGCVPPLRPPCVPKPAPKWTATPMGYLMYCDRPVGDLRYSNARGRIPFILKALNDAEEKQ